MKCNYRNCQKELPIQEGYGRKRKFCNNNCKRMEQYYRGKKSEPSKDK